jgi:hypothetical protein
MPSLRSDRWSSPRIIIALAPRTRRRQTDVAAAGFGLKFFAVGWERLNPVLRVFMLAAVGFFCYEFTFFHFVLHKTWTAASFYVVETMTNVGFGETAVTARGPLVTGGAIAAMLGGIIFTSIFIGYVSSALTRAQWMALQGMRRIRAHGHVVICGGGKIGSAVVNLLTAAGKRVVVIESNPDASLVRRARDRDVDLLTGDAQRDDALDLCDIPHASAVLALTDNDAINVEIALGARARRPDVPLVVRMDNDAFAGAVSEIFGIAAFSPSALTAPALAGLARFPGTRGRVRCAGEDHTISQRSQGAQPEKPPADVCIPLCVLRNGHQIPIREFSQMKPYDELLLAVPLAQFRPARESLERSAVAEDHRLSDRSERVGRQRRQRGDDEHPAVTHVADHPAEHVGQRRPEQKHGEELQQVAQRGRVEVGRGDVGGDEAAAVDAELFDDRLRRQRPAGDRLVHAAD